MIPDSVTDAADYVRIFDTTLRDGEQSPGATMNSEEKLAIARQLERLNVDVIEAGFAASSPGDFAAVERIAQVVRELVAQVAEVDVDGDRAELDRGQQRRHRLDRVVGVEADVAAGPDSLGGQVVGEPVGLVLELAVGDLQVAVDQGHPVGERVGGVLEDVGHIQCHG